MNKNIPITLLTGYLGSGKTTLINYILKNNDNKKIAIIVNDIGSVNIDASLIEKDGIVSKKDESLVALSNGCICCNLKMDLVEQIFEIIKQDKFEEATQYLNEAMRIDKENLKTLYRMGFCHYKLEKLHLLYLY